MDPAAGIEFRAGGTDAAIQPSGMRGCQHGSGSVIRNADSQPDERHPFPQT